MNKKAILHIGLEKTGTSSIQRFLCINREKFREDDIYIPRCLGRENHKSLAAYAFDEGSQDIAVKSVRNESCSDDVEIFRQKTESALTAELENKKERYLVVSSEDLSRLFNKHEVKRVVDLLKTAVKDLHVVVFLRRQDLLAVSRYYSLLLGGSKSNIVLPMGPVKTPRYYDYISTLRNWADLIGWENITAVRFPEEPSKEGFNSVSAFCSILGINEKEYLLPESHEHVSLDAVNQIIIRHLNLIRDELDHNAILKTYKALKEKNDQNYRFIVGQDQAKQFYAKFSSDNKFMFKNLNLENGFFTEDFSMYPEKNARDELKSLAISRLLEIYANS